MFRGHTLATPTPPQHAVVGGSLAGNTSAYLVSQEGIHLNANLAEDIGGTTDV